MLQNPFNFFGSGSKLWIDYIKARLYKYAHFASGLGLIKMFQNPFAYFLVVNKQVPYLIQHLIQKMFQNPFNIKKAFTKRQRLF